MCDWTGPVLKVKLLSDAGKAPVRGTARAAGYDLFAAKDVTIPAGTRSLIPTDIAIAIPAGHYGQIAPRSSLALKHSIDIGAGVIDEDYRGPLGILLVNDGTESFEVKRGDRIAQLLLVKISTPVVSVVNDLDETERGSGGFGSTGR